MSVDKKYMLEKVFIATNIPVLIFDEVNQVYDIIGVEDQTKFKNAQEYSLSEEMLKKLDRKKAPFVEVKNDNFVYFAFFDDEGYKYIIGPHLLEAYRHRKEYFEVNKPSDVISKIIYTRCEKLMNDFYLYYSCVTGEKISSADIFGVDKVIIAENGNIEQEINHYRIQKNEQEFKRLSYEFENNYMLAIEYGRADSINNLSSLNVEMSKKVGSMAKNSLKQTEYTIASSIVLVTRAAIRGGVNPSEAYEIADLYFQKLEKCTTQLEMEKLNISMKNRLSEMVKQVRSKKRNMGYVEQCKDYIIQNVYSTLRVEEIAKIIGINSNYLSRKFTEQEGTTISQFIIQTRLNVAQDLLRHSKMDIAEISEYLCFSSQSHFGQLFKKEYGISPLQYKKQHMVIEVKAPV